ncbi:MAG: hypothetical protein OXI55_04830 [Gammaproteobacteria bacterium]|nr:hypothetical protein [Gammaproteobacteria bacterium]
MKNRVRFATVAIVLMASSAVALTPNAGSQSSSVQAKLQYVVGPTPSDFPSLSDYMIAMTPWPSTFVTHSISAL